MNRSLPAFLLLLLSEGASATCVIKPFKEQLRAADSVFVATITSAERENSLPLKDGQRFRVNFKFLVSIPLKGDPKRTGQIFSIYGYHDPNDETDWDFAEEIRLVPGDSVLVVAYGAEDAQVGLCTPSKKIEGGALVAKARTALAL